MGNGSLILVNLKSIMGENGIPMEYQNGGNDSRYENGEMLNGVTNGDHKHHSSKHKHKDKNHDKERRKETEEERRIRKEKERDEREKRYKKEGKRLETEEERKIRKDKERKEREKKEGRREETEEERASRKEKERRERENRNKNENRREETEEERAIRKERERKEREERKIRKEKERREKDEKHKHREKDHHNRSHKETEEERRIRKERERRERKGEVNDHKIRNKADLDIKNEPEDSQENYTAQSENGEENYKMECDVKEEPHDSEEDTVLVKKSAKSNDNKKRRGQTIENDQDYAPTKKKKRPKIEPEEYDEEPEEHVPAKIKKEKTKAKKQTNVTVNKGTKAGKKGVKKEEPEVWKWWEEEKKDDGKKWYFLQHQGPMFAPDYEKLPDKVRFYYDGKAMKLSKGTEEIATFYGRMLDHDYTTREVFNKNFFKDWRKVMTNEEREKIRDLSKCDFNEINEYFKKVSEERKNRTKEEKKAEKEKNEAIAQEYGMCVIDGHEEKIGNFRIEPPGLFRGRGEHPKQGCLKRRTMPEDVIVNCSADSEWPRPPEGHEWKKVQHDNTVTWLASWQENVQNQIKYVMLNPSSKLKGEKDMMKYEKARQLKGTIGKIRDNYNVDLKSKEMRIRQRAVALYFIDKLALRAGNEKDEDSADTVGCCSLRVEHITCHAEKDGKEFVIGFDFLGKDSIRYYNEVEVEKRVFKNVQLFMDNKKPGDDLFDRLNTTILNEYLNTLMPGLTAKVFRTYNASIVLQEQLDELTNEDDNVTNKI